MKHNELLISFDILENEVKTVELDRIYPLGNIDYCGDIEVEISDDNTSFNKIDLANHSFNDVTARYIKVTSSKSQKINIYLGLGYYCIRNEEFSKKFERRSGWTGADGIFSFNLDNEEDYSQENNRTLFVFGDTFFGATEGNKRIEPTAMVNNSLGYLENDEIKFVVNKDDKGHACSLFEPSEDMLKVGYLAKNLTSYKGVKEKPYVSSLDDERDVVIDFDLIERKNINKIRVVNFYDEPELGTSNYNRGVKSLDLYTSLDSKEYVFVKKVELELNEDGNKYNDIEVELDARYVRFVIAKKDNVYSELDNCLGLTKVYFYDEEGQLNEVRCKANQEFNYSLVKSWYWLQDGIRVKDKFYIYPLLIQEELNGIEGFEFKMDGVAKLVLPIKEGKVDYLKADMETVSTLYKLVDEKEYVFPVAITREGDYAYFYGYCNERSKFLRHLIVGRIEIEKIDDLNNLKFFDGNSFVRDVTKAKYLVDHISCEMSVQKIVEGENKGKCLAVFQYDTNGPKVAYAIGDSLVGPFTSPRIIYVTPEVEEINKGTTYTYNAKAHLHLSSKKNILVSYNVNDTSMAQNKLNYKIYHPRFLNFIDTSND